MDIVDKLSLMPISEWLEAREEILKLRAIIAAGGAISSSEVTEVPLENDDELLDYKRMVMVLEDQVATADSQLRDAELATSRLTDEVNLLKSRLTFSIDLGEHVSKLNKELEDYSLREKALVEEFKEFKLKYDDLVSASIKFKTDIASAKGTEEVLTLKLRDAESTISNLTDTLEGVRTSNKQLTKDLEKATEDHHSLMTEYASLEGLLKSKKSFVGKVGSLFSK